MLLGFCSCLRHVAADLNNKTLSRAGKLLRSRFLATKCAVGENARVRLAFVRHLPIINL